ncbi:MAG TPA: outer membrane protein assembly factor BamA [Kofleriaceae bacterium]|nr:outer membrane protein assembly factor BamA [Kofleriaceae bacterium]
MRAGRTFGAALALALAFALVAIARPVRAQSPAPTPAPAPQPQPQAGPGDDDPEPQPGDQPGDQAGAPDDGTGDDEDLGPIPRMAGRPIDRIQFRGNRKVEDEAIRVNLKSLPGGTIDPSKIRDDIRSLWKMKLFSDVVVEASLGPGGGAILTFAVKEKPSIRKVLIDGAHELSLDKINEVVDLDRDEVLDIGKVKQNRDKIADLYVDQGYYLATVDYEVRPVNEAEVDVWFTVEERSKVEIRDVEFIGNHAISDDELRNSIATRKGGALSFLSQGGTFNEKDFERDLLIINALYWDRGYAAVKLGTPQLELSRDKKYMYVSIPIDEGPVFTIGDIQFKGGLIGDEAAHRAKIKAKPGDRFSRATIAGDRERLSDYYMDQGYAYANINPMTIPDMDKRTISLVYEIESGKKAYFERITIRGNSKTRDKVIRREMKISEGELYSATNLEASKRRILALGFFDDVQVSTKRGSSDELVEVEVQVSERPTGTFQIGAGFSSVENFIAQAQVSQNNLFGRGQELALQAQLSSLRQLFLLRFVEPYLLDSNWTFAIELYNQLRAFDTFARKSAGFSLTAGYPISYYQHAYLTYKLEDVGITTATNGLTTIGAISQPIDSEAVANLFRGGVTSSVRASWQWDSRNNRLFATGGWYHNLSVEYAGAATGSENVFVRWDANSRYYKKIWGPFLLRLNGEVGVTTSTDPLGVPIAERYLIGGIYDVRGYRPRSLGPLLLTGRNPDQSLQALPLGGNMEVIWNSEVEFPLLKRLQISGVVFFDMGNAYNLEARYCSGLSSVSTTLSPKFDPCFRIPSSLTTGLRKSVGFGFRWQSPIGPLRFEWGIPLDRQTRPDGQTEDPLVFEFTIGNPF